MNKQISIQNTKERAINSATAVIKKRINSLFQESQLILIWATFKPIRKSFPILLEKKMIENATNAIKISQKENREQKQNLVALILQEDERKITKVSKISLPKNALQTFCFNFNLPIAGSGLDLLIITKTDLLATPVLSENSDHSSTTILNHTSEKNLSSSDSKEMRSVDTPCLLSAATSLQRIVSENFSLNLVEQSKLLSVRPISSFNEPLLGLNRLIKTHQAALFMNLALDEACKLEEKWDSNQLLGAFIKNSKNAIFVTNAELKQALLLHKCLKKTPELVIRQPFIEVLGKMKAPYLEQSKWLNPLKNFFFLINYSKSKFLLNLSLASAKKKS